MKQKSLLIAFLLMIVLGASAQNNLSRLTVYNEFRPAIAYLADGKKLTLPMANIFLKNSSLLYMSSNGTPMEAEMKNINRVDFQDRSYFRIDSLLCYKVDSVDNSALFCARVIDLKAFRQIVKNNTSITNLDLSFNTVLGYTTIETNEEENFPIIPIYYFKIGDRYVQVHERHLKRFLNKDKRRLMESVMSMKGFSWTDEKFLMQMLQLIH
jgi:hypothetical protein